MTEKNSKLAGVRFRDNWKVYDFDATDVAVAVGDSVIVDSESGPSFARVVRIRKFQALAAAELLPAPVLAPGELEEEVEEETEKGPADTPPKGQSPKVIRHILRKATGDDVAKEEKNRARETEAFTIAQEMIAERELSMKLIRVEYSFDGNRVTFFFFSETRVDFRELVKDLAYKLKSRIEMRQIGVRDVARIIGGFGPCGRELCCASFLKNFEPVSIRMAKKQEMVLNPAKISGVCGRLLCCLSYEYQMYDEIKKDLADMHQSAAKELREKEESRIAEEQRAAEERRIVEDKKRQEERRQQEQQRQRQREQAQKIGNKTEKKKEAPQGKHAQPQKEQHGGRQQQSPEKQQSQEQTVQPPQQQGEKPGKKRKRRFWRNKKKGKQQGENMPQGPGE